MRLEFTFFRKKVMLFNIHRNKSVSVKDFKSAVTKEIIGGDRLLLGFCAKHSKIKKIHRSNMPGDLVYAAMTDLDSDGLKMRQPRNKKPKEKGTFKSAAPN